ncbi:hypothetical protein Vafri_17444 [Volvox africanus]|uniref:Uncharacterized protein n=1 Tax=Volvox africanus TaxID=51714 RepID=A0A8J4BJC1_9CHLO|nr:hypothetical protein Vafri_17444 [Volvox africanus]
MANSPTVAMKALILLGAFLTDIVRPSSDGSTGGSSISEPSRNYSNIDITHNIFCAPTTFPAGVNWTTRMELVPRFDASASLVEADGDSALVTNSSQPSMLDATFCGVDEDVNDAGNHLESVKERDLLFPTVAFVGKL